MSKNDVELMDMDKFYRRVKELIVASVQYSMENVKVIGEEENLEVIERLNDITGLQRNTRYISVEVFTAIPKELLLIMSDVVHDFVVIVETHKMEGKFQQKEKRFLSGMKFVDNIIKHTERNYGITDLLVPDVKMETEMQKTFIDADGTIAVGNIEIRLGANWADVTSEMKKNPRNNRYYDYKKNLKGKDIFDTAIYALQIVQKYA